MTTRWLKLKTTQKDVLAAMRISVKAQKKAALPVATIRSGVKRFER
jgi:hypothetical protein